MIAYLCSRDDRVTRLEWDGQTWATEPVLEGVSATCVAADGERVLVGTQGHGARLSFDGGGSWKSIDLPEGNVFSVAISGADGALYAGTEPSRLFVSRGGGSWTELEALQDVPSKEQWTFPPRPWTHHVRWIAPDPHVSERLLVGIELGGVMYSEDAGRSFADHRPGAKRDAHCLAWHPFTEGRAYEAAGDGAAWSRDGGVSWEAADSGRDLRYCWALAPDPADPDRWYVSAGSGPRTAHAGENSAGRLYVWEGSAWRPLDPPGGSMPYALAAIDGALLVGMANGGILHSRDRGETWEETARIGPVLAMAAAGR